MPYTIRLPDGKLVENIPDEITPQEAKQRIIKAFPQYAPPESAFRQVADIPLQIGRGAVSGVRMIADAFGADNPASEALRGAEDYIGSLLSAQAKKDQQEIARILKDAEDKGVLDQVKAGFQALTVAPIDTLSQFLGTAAPTIVTGLGGAMLKLGATGIGAMQAGTGAAMGAGLAKGNIYEVVKDELVKSGIDEKTAEDRARQAQEYGGENLDQILLSAGLGGVAALGPLERIFARAPAIPADVAAKNMFGRAVQGGIIEGTPEAAQAFQEQVAQNIALQREGFDVPTFRGAVANATLEGLAGFGIGAPIGMFSKPPTPEVAAAETPPGAEPPLALPPPSPPEGPTGPGGPPGLPQLGGPSPTLPLLPGMAPSQFIVGDQMIRPQEQPEPIVRGPEEQPPTAIEEPTPPTEPPPTAPAAEPVDEIAALNDQLKMIEMRRMDPTLSPNDPIFEQLDATEQNIRRKLLSLSGSPEPLDKATTPAPVITPPVTPPTAVAPAVTPPVAPPAAPPVTPPVIAPPVITTGELPEGRDPKEIKAEINRVRQSLQRTQTAVKKGQLPESDIPRLETRISNLEQELEQAKSLPKQVKYRNKEGKTWSGKGDYPPWLRASISQGFDLSEFEVLPELGNRSEDEVGFEAERPPGFGSPVPPTRIPAEMEETIAETERVRKASPNLFSVLRGRVTPQDVNDISPDTSMRLLKAKEGSGRDVSDLVEDGVLDDFLPYELRTDSGMFDPYVATEYIKDLLRQNPVDNPEARLSYDARVELNSLGIKLSELEQELEPEDVNRELQAIAAEERAVAQEAEADVLKEPQRGPAVPTGPPEFALQGETLEEAKARTERAEADREAFERKRAADLEREVFRLQPTPSAPAPAATTGDLFGAAGMADQPARKPATVAAEPTPIEAEAAKIPPIEEAIKAELKKAGYEDLNKMSEAIQEGFGVSKPVADAYAKSVQNARIQHIRAQYGEITGEQLMDALNERDRLRKRIDGIVKRLKPKAVAQTEAEPKKEEKPSIRKETEARPEVQQGQEATDFEFAQDVLTEYVAVFRKILPSSGPRSYDAETNTITEVLVVDEDETMSREDFDALVSIAKASDSSTGRKYSIIVEDTPDKSSIFTFQPRRLKPTDKKVPVVAQLEETNRYVEELTLDQQIKKTLDLYGLSDRATASKKNQEKFGISKPVADALVRADIERLEMSWKKEYGTATEAQHKEASKKYFDLLDKAEQISKQQKRPEKETAPGAAVEPEAKKEPSAEPTKEKARPNFYLELLPKAGFTRLDIDNPRTYKNKGGESFLTFERDGVRVAFESGNILYADEKGRVGRYFGNDPTVPEGPDSILAALIVDPKDRKQGKARKALQEIVRMADESNTNLYLEPASLDTEGMTTPQLKEFYKQFGFEPQTTPPASDRVMVRKHGAKVIAPKAPETIGPTISEMQAEIDRLNAEAAARGESAMVVWSPPSRIAEKKAAKEKKKTQKLLKEQMKSWKIEQRYNELRAAAPDMIPTWESLTDEQRYLLSQMDKPENLTSENIFKIVDESKTIDAEVREVPPIEQRLLTEQVTKLSDEEISTLESHYGDRAGTDSFFNKLGQDIAAYVNKGADFVADKIRGIIAKLAKAVVAIAVVFNPTIQQNGFNFDLPDAYAKAKQIAIALPVDVRTQMSPMAISVFTEMAATAQQTGKGFIIADKPNGMIHIFDKDGKVIAQDTALYGKDVGDVLASASALAGGKKITPAGKYALEAVKLRDGDTYAGGYTLDLVGTNDGTGTIAIHAAYLGNVNEKRLERLATPDVKDNRVSYGCINTSHKTFLNKIIPNISKLDGGMVFVLPDNPERFVMAKGNPDLLNIEEDMPGDLQGDLFGSTSEAKNIAQAMEPKGKKLPPGRSPELAAAARAVQAGSMSAAEYNKLVDVYKPIQTYAEALRPATSEQVFDALDVKKREQINPQIPNGTKVGLRLDIPAFNRKGIFVVSIHQKRTASAPGKVIGYGSVAKAKNVTFGVGNQLKALEIAAGAAKDALQTIEGEYVNISPEQAYAEAQRAIKDPSYVQVGIDPTRHAYFYDRATTLPIISAEEVIQIGNMILAKKPVFGKKQDFLYNIEAGPIAGGDAKREDFLRKLFAEEGAKREVERQEKIAYYASVRRQEAALQKRVREYGSTLETQRLLNNLNQVAKELKEDIDIDRTPVYSAENFLRQARAALEGRTPYKEPTISADVFSVIQAMYMDDPKLLEGLRLSIKPEFSPSEDLLRRAYGIRGAAGAFTAFQRMIYLYTGTRGVTDPKTIRHEVTHSLEQMMTDAQRKVLINAYFDSLQKAIKKHKDARSQEFFERVTEFLNNPTEKNQAAVTKALPSYDLYQYVNPSEFWAVNAEKLMAQRLGTSWDRFKKSIRKMFEKMKDIFGFDNRYAVHDVFDKIMSGSKERLNRKSLNDFALGGSYNLEFLNNIQDDADLISKYNRSDTPMLDTAPMKRMMIDAVQFSKDAFTEMVNSPTEALRMTFNSLNRGVMYLRNKNIWFGSGLNEADRIKYNGQVRTANGLATASLALDNMLRGGNIATQALFLGGIEYNPNTLTFTAVRKEKNMTKVYEAEAAIKKRIGEQLGTNIIQGYLEAKRSRSIKDEVIARTPKVEKLKQDYETRAAALKKMEADPKAKASDVSRLRREIKQISRELKDAQEDLDNIKAIAKDKVTMSDAEIADFISREQAHPELKEIMDNFNAVNQNMLKFWRQVGLLSQSRYETLAGIKDYVPWYRIMNDEEDVHSPLQATTRSATNIGREKIFKSGKPSVINDFIIEENQDLFKIQPGRINMVKLNGKRLTDKDFTVTPQGEVRLTVPYKPGDVLVIQTQREIENMIDNMTRNVMRMTMNGLRQYAAQRIVSEYATRGADGKIMTFPTVDRERGRFDFISEGRRVVVEIQDPLIAEAALGMETVGMQMWKPLAAAANFTRRTITLSPVFQLKQVFKDAPTAALVTGVKNPAALLGGVYKGFIDAVRDSDPAASILRSAGIGGFYSPARTPEADVKRRIGIINNNTFDYVMKGLDHWGDSSDMAQRIATYNRVMAETGDEALAMYQAANVINFLRHGSGQLSQALVKTVPFLNAYAQSIDVLYNALVGGGLRGLDRKKALQRLAFTGGLLAGTTLLYAMLVGDDDDYLKMDDQSKVRSYMIPGTDVVLPMNTSAAFFFKAIPELIYNKVVNEGTENEMDERRLRRAMKESAIDMLLGPTPIPSAVKPFIEISLDYNFFTSRSITPRGMENLDAYQQYDMRTSEAAKLLSGLTGTTENRLLNPMDADHLIRSLFGTAGAMAAWSSNLIGQGSEYRPEMGLKDMPITGAFLRQEVPRGREDLFYTLKESTDRKYRTLNRLIERDNMAEADAYLEKYPNLIAYYDYTSEVDTSLKEINAAIRYIGETQDPSYTPDRKREEIRELLEMKNDILEGVEMFRKEAYAD